MNIAVDLKNSICNMKARKLKKILNNIDYIYSNHKEYIAVGSSLCHDLLSVNKTTLKVRYALDTFREGRKALENRSEELLFIWDKLHELIETGEINDIINVKDNIENPLLVYTVIDGELIESITDEYGWPNVTDDGICMYNNDYFKTKEEAVDYAIKNYGYVIKNSLERITEKEKELIELKDRLSREQNYITHLEKLKNSF